MWNEDLEPHCQKKRKEEKIICSCKCILNSRCQHSAEMKRQLLYLPDLSHWNVKVFYFEVTVNQNQSKFLSRNSPLVEKDQRNAVSFSAAHDMQPEHPYSFLSHRRRKAKNRLPSMCSVAGAHPDQPQAEESRGCLPDELVLVESKQLKVGVTSTATAKVTPKPSSQLLRRDALTYKRLLWCYMVMRQPFMSQSCGGNKVGLVGSLKMVVANFNSSKQGFVYLHHFLCNEALKQFTISFFLFSILSSQNNPLKGVPASSENV